MDIMMPSLREQPAPAPWLQRRERVVAQTLHEAFGGKTPADPRQIAEQLKIRDADFPADLIGEMMRKHRGPTA
jgi:hypothetical protein